MTPDAGAAAGPLEAWLAGLRSAGEIGRLLAAPADEQAARGYRHTLREIAQQPETWLETSARMIEHRDELGRAASAAGLRDGTGAVVLTGSGSSLYVATSLAGPLQEDLGAPVSAVAAGSILTHPRACLPPGGRFLMVSFARSGDSPESGAAIDLVLARAAAAQHLIFTCNRRGRLVTAYAGEPRVGAVVLDDTTNDRSLVMTSSFTNLALAGRALAGLAAGEYLERARRVADAARRVLTGPADALAAAARGARRLAFLGSGARFGSAREAALKLLEMNAARVPVLVESYLGLRHGPMSALRPDTLLVALLSSDPLVRAYELDLLGELNRKRLGGQRIVVGVQVPAAAVAGPHDVVVECGEAGALADSELILIDALVGQLLGLFRCLAEGLKPDAPSDGIINRVVEPFAIHRHPAKP